MAIENAKELLKAIQTDPKSKELFNGAMEPRSEEEMIHLCMEAASRLGFNVQETDIREAIAEVTQERLNKTTADVQKLSDEEVSDVAGGDWWRCDDASDGHEYNCVAFWHGEEYQIQEGLSCQNVYLCSYNVAVTTDSDLLQKYARCADAYFHIFP